MDSSTAVYRYFDHWDRLLYVGVSLSAVGRLAEHRDTAPWFRLVETVKIVWFVDRATALEAERDAVTSERPYFNVVHRQFVELREWEHPHAKYANNSLLGIHIE